MMNPDLKRNNLKAFAFLASPLILAGFPYTVYAEQSHLVLAGNSVLRFSCPNLYSVTECGHFKLF